MTEYTDMLIENDSSVQKYLEIQNYSEETELWNEAPLYKIKIQRAENR